MKIKPLDIAVIVLFLAAGVFLSVRAFSNKSGKVHVCACGTEYLYALDEDGIYNVEGLCGKTVFEITEGRVHILESACPNKTCVAQGFSTVLVCLPNDVIITVEDDGTDGVFDAVTD